MYWPSLLVTAGECWPVSVLCDCDFAFGTAAPDRVGYRSYDGCFLRKCLGSKKTQEKQQE